MASARRAILSPAAASSLARGSVAGSVGGFGEKSFPGAYRSALRFQLRHVAAASRRDLCFQRVPDRNSRKFCLAHKAKGRDRCPRHMNSVANRFDPPWEMAWCIPAKPLSASGQPVAFISPVLEESRALSHQVAILESEEHNTMEWVELLALWDQEWQNLKLEEEERVDSGEEGAIKETGEDSGSESEPAGSLFELEEEWESTYIARAELTVPTEGNEFDVDMEAVNGKALASTREVVAAILAFLHEVAAAPGLEAQQVVQYHSDQLRRVSRSVNRAVRQLRSLGRAVGDVDSIQERYVDVASGLDAAPEHEDLRALESKVAGLRAEIEETEDRLQTDVYESAKIGLEKVGACFDRLRGVERELGVGLPEEVGAEPLSMPRSPSLPISSIGRDIQVTGDTGGGIATIGDLLDRIEALERRADAAEARVSVLETELSHSGGFTVGQLKIASRADIRVHVMKEDPKGASIAAFVNPLTLPCHDKEYAPSSDWASHTKDLRKTGEFTTSELKFVAACSQQYSAHYMGQGVEVEAGKRVFAFKTMKAWTGVGESKGRKRRIEESIRTSSLAARTYIRSRLPAGGALSQIAESSIERTADWTKTLHQFFDNDIQELSDMGVAAAETLTLLSDYTIIIFDSYYRELSGLEEFTLGKVRADWLVELIWINLKILAAMDGITEGGDPKYNPTLATAFIRFLTKATAENNGAKLGQEIASIKSDLEKWKIPKVISDLAALKKKA